MTPRLGYITKTLFTDRFGIRVQITSDREDFGNYNGAKINYSKEALWDCPQIKPAGLLFEKRIQDQDIQVNTNYDIPLFYADAGNQLGFDPFAASFYFLSRFEEYLPYRKDEHGRFYSESSILKKYKAITIPLVDFYAQRLLDWLVAVYPQLEFKKPIFKTEVTIDVDQLFLYRARGIARSLLGGVKDAVLNRPRFSKRLEVLIGNKRDPIDVYDEVNEYCKGANLKPICFFQVGEQTRFDLNNPLHLPRVRNKINQIAVNAEIGIHPSYYSSENLKLLEMECERLRTVSSNTILKSRQHYLKFRLPSTYRALEEQGIEHEYSMGFSDVNGFRASTAHPFRFYDLEREEETFLTIHPLIYMDIVSVRKNKSLAESMEEANKLKEIVKQVNGIFSTTWHPEVLVGFDVPFPSMEILKNILKKLND